jgi:hypothetical protein
MRWNSAASPISRKSKPRIEDLGVICLIFNIAFDEDVSYEEYMDVVIATDVMPDELVRDFLNSVLETIKPACTNERISGVRRRVRRLLLPGSHSPGLETGAHPPG